MKTLNTIFDQPNTFCVCEFACSRYLIEVESYNVFLLCLAYFTKGSVFKIHPRCSLCQYLTPFSGQILFCCMSASHFLLFCLVSVNNAPINTGVGIILFALSSCLKPQNHKIAGDYPLLTLHMKKQRPRKTHPSIVAGITGDTDTMRSKT